MKALVLYVLSSLSVAAALPAVGPDYRRPSVAEPAAYRDAGPATGWKLATPSDHFQRGEWWRLFEDPVLDELESRALAQNQSLHAAAARVDQARAIAGLARAAYFPSIALDGGASRERGSSATDNRQPIQHTTTFGVGLNAAWELDLFGRVRRQNESARNDALASAATFEALRLSLAADVASTYFALRAVDHELSLLETGVALRQRALDLVGSRRGAGTATDFDVARAEADLASTQAESAALQIRRSQLQNALAVLLGEPATDFELARIPATPGFRAPEIPAGLPADLLERRPDVAAAERSLAAANARIGVARAAFFPAISLTGGAGHASGDIGRLFSSDARAWSIGPSIYLPIFQGGRNRANLARSRAAHEEAVAESRERVLVAFQEVQDALTAARLLADQAGAQDRALSAARTAADLARRRYEAGFVNFFEVIDAERTSLATERGSAQLAAQQLTNSVFLIKALGGGWSVSGPAVSIR